MRYPSDQRRQAVFTRFSLILSARYGSTYFPITTSGKFIVPANAFATPSTGPLYVHFQSRTDQPSGVRSQFTMVVLGVRRIP
jgi:hypothetical protein